MASCKCTVGRFPKVCGLGFRGPHSRHASTQVHAHFARTHLMPPVPKPSQVHPKASLHGIRSAASATNPWGVQLNGASAARARERLKGRTGL
jgi:hypothetical protein